MKTSEDWANVKEVFARFKNGIKTDNLSQIMNCLAQINVAEESFLDNYQERKNEGVYYTSRDISDFIISEALLLYINKKFDNFPINSLKEIFNLDPPLKKEIHEILMNVTVYDPACGSGKFLVSAADAIYNLVKSLSPSSSDLTLKMSILKNLHGSDINTNAIRLCTLNLFNWIFKEKLNNFSDILPILESNLKVENSIFLDNQLNHDLIITNPPYGNILNPEEKAILKKKRIFFKDIYCTFLMKAIEWSDGILGFLIPKSFLLRQGYVKLRESFLSNVNLLKIYDIGPNMFKKATNEVQIILYEKKNGKSSDLEIYDYPDHYIMTYKEQKVDSLKICLNIKCPLSAKSKKIYPYTHEEECPFCHANTFNLNRIRIKSSSKILKIIEKIEIVGDLNYLNIVDFPKMIRGEEDLGLKKVKRLVMDNTKGTCIYLKARNDLSPYYMKRNKSLNIEEIDSEILKGSKYEYYRNPKLLIKHNTITPEAVYTEDPVCFTSSIYSLLHEEIEELKYLNAVLNSSLIQFYCIYGINNQKDTTINLNQYMIRHLPIVKPDMQIKSKIISRVNNVLNLFWETKGKLEENITKELREIDALIFNLYDLSEDEQELIISKVKIR
ncbi:MAG: hypothetical protein EU539_05560 [Promethearchaeota archaeon]|nr:MAG: hypothetical protein EU539_05560 [Candidatus Lokiarchaeota archaeon]